MEKLKMHSIDMTKENVRRLGELFPECITETVNEDGKLEKAVDFSVLNDVLSGSTVNYANGGGCFKGVLPVHMA